MEFLGPEKVEFCRNKNLWYLLLFFQAFSYSQKLVKIFVSFLEKYSFGRDYYFGMGRR